MRQERPGGLSGEEQFQRSIEWPLTSQSVVVECGGYQGIWAKAIAERYRPRLYVFEPQRWAYKQCRRALQGCGARVFNYGLGERDGEGLPMGEWHTDGCSFLKPIDAQPYAPEEGAAYGRLREVGAVFSELGIGEIDLMQVNCEGYEFRLLPHMLERGWLQHIQRIVVQFHLPPQIPYKGKDVAELNARMGETHRVQWEGAFTAWVRNGA